MNKVTIADFIDKIGDGIHGTPCYSENGSYYFVNGNNLKDGHIVVDSSTLKIEQNEHEKIKRPLNENTILISINGTIGNLAFYNGEKIALGKSACYLNVKSMESKHYIRYVLSTQEFKKYALQVAHGSTIKNLAPGQIAEYTFFAPDSASRTNIAYVLKTLDDKIENNNKICSELESMAKTLYDYWFVQFDFPDENGKPYRTSGGEMVWNEQLKREIPKGWEATRLGNICDFRNGINYDKDVEGDQEYRIINVRNISSASLLLNESELDKINLPSVQADKYLLSSDDIVIARSGTPGATRLLWKINEPTIFCGFIICSTPHEALHKIYLTYCLKRLEGTSATKTGGSILQNVSQDTLKNLFVLIPDREVLRQFNAVISLILEKFHSNIDENNELTKLRDWLLPMLMNGQARVE